MKTLSLTVKFISPAFLGDAAQSGRWRTPPFKAALRQWWRVAYSGAHGHHLGVDQMRQDEAMLFGTVEDKPRQARLRLRLSQWSAGQLKSWAGNKSAGVFHREVGHGGSTIDPQLYLGYGPLNYDKTAKGTALKANAALDAGESAVLKLAYPDDAQAGRIEQALALLSQYGALGGRSRNGWGSLTLSSGNEPSMPEQPPVNDWRQALELDWPHAIGRDDKAALIWRTQELADWRTCMRQLAIVKIGLRTQFSFHTGKDAARPEERHWLAYPVTNHSVKAWGEKLRLPNSLRFKLRPTPGGKVVGIVFHMPCLPPAQFRPEIGAIERVWQQVHAFLDNPDNGLVRIPA